MISTNQSIRISLSLYLTVRGMRKPGSWLFSPSLWQRMLVLREAGPATPSLSSDLASTRKAVPLLVSTCRRGLGWVVVRVSEMSSSTRPGILADCQTNNANELEMTRAQCSGLIFHGRVLHTGLV